MVWCVDSLYDCRDVLRNKGVVFMCGALKGLRYPTECLDGMGEGIECSVKRGFQCSVVFCFNVSGIRFG